MIKCASCIGEEDSSILNPKNFPDHNLKEASRYNTVLGQAEGDGRMGEIFHCLQICRYVLSVTVNAADATCHSADAAADAHASGGVADNKVDVDVGTVHADPKANVINDALLLVILLILFNLFMLLMVILCCRC